MNRYDRNTLIEEIGESGQVKLSRGKVLVIGAGGLGSPVLLYLAAAGVGTLGIVDYDAVDITNLQRQILHHTPDIGKLKTISAKEKLELLNPNVEIKLYQEKFTIVNGKDIISEYDFVVDCCDSFETKFLINDICVAMQKPYSHGAILALQGEIMTYLPGNACYRCVFDDSPDEGNNSVSSQTGVLGAIAGVVGSIQAAEVIKFLTGVGELITNRILIFDGKKMTFHSLKAHKKECCVCESGN